MVKLSKFIYFPFFKIIILLREFQNSRQKRKYVILADYDVAERWIPEKRVLKLWRRILRSIGSDYKSLYSGRDEFVSVPMGDLSRNRTEANTIKTIILSVRNIHYIL
jgi:hypothetical protein